MKSYGNLVIYEDLAADLASFKVDLFCSSRPVFLGGGSEAAIPLAEYSKTIRRIAPSKNPLRLAKKAVSDYAGCDEASIVRKRIISLAKTRLSISGETFRFRLP